MDRRSFLVYAAAAATWPSAARAVARPPALRRLRLTNIHTGETFEGTYRDNTGPIDRVMEELCVFLRDHHSGEKTQIDVGLIDFLADILDAVGETSATILSAYRTAETNAMLARTTFGVAEHSQHIYGRALDVSLGSKLGEAMNAARAARERFGPPAHRRPAACASASARPRGVSRPHSPQPVTAIPISLPMPKVTPAAAKPTSS